MCKIGLQTLGNINSLSGNAGQNKATFLIEKMRATDLTVRKMSSTSATESAGPDIQQQNQAHSPVTTSGEGGGGGD